MKIRTVVTAMIALLLISGCSRDTTLTVQADILSFMDAEDRSGSLTVAAAETEIPDDDGIAASELGLPDNVLETLQALSVELRAALSGADAVTEVTVGLYLADASAAGAFAGAPVEEVSAVVSPGSSSELSATIEISSEVNQDALELLQSGEFQLGVRLSFDTATASNVDYTLEGISLNVSAKPGLLLPF